MKKNKRNSHFPSKIKLGFGLVVLLLMLLVANKFEENNLAEIDQSFVSIFEDRLVPATSIFDLHENLYRKRELMERVLFSNHCVGLEPSQFIASCNHNIDSLLEAYKQTYFVDEETSHLQQFEKDLARYDALEMKMLGKLERDEKTAAAEIFEEQMAAPFDAAIEQLSELNHLQVEAGKDLVAGEKVAGASIKMLFRLEAGLLLLIGLISYLLIRQSTIIMSSSFDKFNLN